MGFEYNYMYKQEYFFQISEPLHEPYKDLKKKNSLHIIQKLIKLILTITETYIPRLLLHSAEIEHFS